jgi:hypothetical protein
MLLIERAASWATADYVRKQKDIWQEEKRSLSWTPGFLTLA